MTTKNMAIVSLVCGIVGIVGSLYSLRILCSSAVRYSWYCIRRARSQEYQGRQLRG